ncbi:MAG: DUF4124 domain-containing protein [Betaproteobacteria bacterium]|nr:DUF4124 domain-containing protein [Betaproteobacteria bacterium]
MRVPAAFALLCLFAAPLGAQTWKWVDARGVVNYSNAPPPEAAAVAAPIEERVSTLPTDPDFVKQVAAMRARAARRAELEEMAWLQRQQILAARAAAPAYEPAPYSAPAPAYYYPAVYGPVFTAVVPRRAHVFRPVRTHVRHSAPTFRHRASSTWRSGRTGQPGRTIR